jgi:hypothetical protein
MPDLHTFIPLVPYLGYVYHVPCSTNIRPQEEVEISECPGMKNFSMRCDVTLFSGI